MSREFPRVLLAVSNLSAGGAERVVAELSNAWAEKGWKIGVLTIADGSSDHYTLDPRVVRFALGLLWDSRGLRQSIASNLRRSTAIRHAVKGFSPDVVLSLIEQTNVRVLAALAGTGTPIIVSERIDPRQYEVGRAWRVGRRLLYPLARAVVVQTESVAEWAKSFLPEHSVKIIPNFVRALPECPKFEQRKHNELLAVGRLSKQKGFDLLLQAFAVSGLKRAGGRLIILGEGPERPFLERLAQELGIADSVSLRGIVQDPERWMAQCALFVLPSRYEGFPNALLEAMAMGCPVIAADCHSGPRDLVLDGENGLLVPPENIATLAERLVMLMGDAAMRRRLGNEAISVRQRFAREPILRRWEEIILRSMEGR